MCSMCSASLPAQSSVDTRQDPVGHTPRVVSKYLCTVLGLDLRVVIDLARNKECDVVERVKPRQRGVVGRGRHNRARDSHCNCLHNLAQVVDVTRSPPKAATQQSALRAGDSFVLDRTEQKCLAAVSLKKELLHVSSTRHDPATQEEGSIRYGCERRHVSRCGRVDERPHAYAVEEGVKDQTAPAELEA